MTGGPRATVRSLPSGTRDVLPEEARQLRAVSRAVIDAMDAAGYGEVQTPALEAGEGISGGLGYAVLDGGDRQLSLRTDMTVPIARLATTRFASEPLPLRLCYLATSWRRVEEHAGHSRELQQAGAELIGAGPESADEVLELSAAVLSAAGLEQWRIGIGHAGVVAAALESADPEKATAILDAVAKQDLVAADALASEAGVPLAAEAARQRIAAADFDAVAAGAEWGSLEGVEDLREICRTLAPEVRERAVVDLGLHPRLDYYSGFLFEIYDPAIGSPIGGGGSYRPLFESLGSDLTGTGFGIDVRLLHEAIEAERRQGSAG